MIHWNETHKCLVDYMGLPLSRTEALELRENIRLHLKHSAADLAHVANQVVTERYPSQPPLSVKGFE